MTPSFPESTYRLQFHAGFTFRDATAIVPYLHALGVTHVYASPYLKARPGSTHGYDVIDHCSLNPELGTQADYDAFCDELARHGMSHILDSVPNHVGVATNDNVWWNDVLEHGPASKYAKYFDIAWRGSPREELHDKVLLPILGGRYGDVLDKGELKVVHEDGKFWVRYYDRRFPLSPESVRQLKVDGLEELNRDVDRLDALLGAQHFRLA
jgi:(1->4)-alpha-D-glucan 1-alpha-D-glucosylmutase